MRNVVFRILAGLLSSLFATFLIVGDRSELPWPKLIGFWVLTVGLALFGFFGREGAAERIMMGWFGYGLPIDRREKPCEQRPPN